MPLQRGQFSHKYPQKTPRSSYGVSFVDPAFDSYSASISVFINVISYNIEPRYNGTRLYISDYLNLIKLIMLHSRR